VPAESLQRLFSQAGATGGYCAKRGEPAVTCKHFHSCMVSRVQSSAYDEVAITLAKRQPSRNCRAPLET
jgi:hypothetical protein